MKTALLALAMIAGFASCKKTETPANPCVASVSTIAGTYKISSITYKLNASATAADMFASVPDCQKDDTYQLNTDGSVVFTDAGVSCGLPPLPGTPISWTLEGNNTRIQMAEFNMTIVSFDCSKLIVSEADLFVPGDNRTTTYVKQ
ncbi:MAG: lipocalin family protein [Chitinophagaceae bacterium]|nr:lipocalin family protein [Chitinophagaceae bacterium]